MLNTFAIRLCDMIHLATIAVRRNKKRLVFVTATGLLVLLYWSLFGRFRRLKDYTHRTFSGVRPTNFSSRGCKKVELDPFHPSVAHFLEKMDRLKCGEEPDWLLVDKGFVKLREDLQGSHSNVDCKITYLVRTSDFTSTRGPVVRITSRDHQLRLEEDFFLAECTDINNGRTWRNIMAGVHRNNNAVIRSAKHVALQHSEMKLNVLIWGYDSVSRMHFMRQMRQTYAYLTKDLGATVLEMYNIVGDGTPQALIPILTGFSETELPETRKRYSNAQYVNVYPFIWKNYTEAGYITSYVEDGPSFGTFSYRLKGFKEKPTDHFGRPFYIEAEKEYRNHKQYCLGSKPRVRVMSDWIKQLWDVYPTSPKFAFGFHSELSHDDFNLLQLADEDSVDWLREVKLSGLLNDTILIVMSDHGNRFSSVRGTEQGKLEERLPFFSFIFPQWFPRKFPNAYQNFNRNAKSRLTTPFDIHATLLTVLTSFNMGKDVPNIDRYAHAVTIPRSLSLFENIPSYRSCQHADIEAHWCTCLRPVAVDENDPFAIKSANALVDYLNGLTADVRPLCSLLRLKKILRAEKILPNNELLSFKESGDYDGFAPDLSDHTQVSEVIYQLQIVVEPSQGIYEASVLYNAGKGTFVTKNSQISRVNMYGDQAQCILKTHQHLRKFCHCKSKTPQQPL